jgi:hypothetical protein
MSAAQALRADRAAGITMRSDGDLLLEADVVIRRALSRDNRGNASGPLGAALDTIARERGR